MQARQGNQLSRTHRVRLRGGDSAVEIDLGYDAALRTTPFTGFAFSDPAAAAAHEIEYPARLGRDLGAQMVVVLTRRVQGDKPIIQGELIDARRSALLRRGSINAGDAGEPAPADVTALTAFLMQGAKSRRLASAETLGNIPVDLASSDGRPARFYTWVAAGGAGAFIIGGTILGLLAKSDFDDLDQRYPDGRVTSKADLDKRDSGHTKAVAADVMFGLAIGAATTSLILFFHEGRGESTAAEILPVVSPTYAGAAATLRF